jgi:hypothetical protein
MGRDEEITGLLRAELAFHLRIGDAHQTFEASVADLPDEAINLRPPNVPYTFWQLLDHVRFCQSDMLDYLRNPGYRAVVFPDDYWPPASELASRQRWDDTLASYRADVDEVERFVRDAGTDLFLAAPQAWEPTHTPLRTVLVMADHAAYHGGEFGILRQVLGLWGADRTDAFTEHAAVSQNLPDGS